MSLITSKASWPLSLAEPEDAGFGCLSVELGDLFLTALNNTSPCAMPGEFPGDRYEPHRYCPGFGWRPSRDLFGPLPRPGAPVPVARTETRRRHVSTDSPGSTHSPASLSTGIAPSMLPTTRA
jgi:hypothetical protein